MNFLRIALVALSFLLAACNPFDEKPAEPEEAAETVSPPAPKAAQMLGEALKRFQPGPEEAALLNEAPAVNVLGQTNGYYTNQAGVSGYFTGYEMPFNFIWKGETKTISAIDGQTYQIMDGPGTILIKYMYDDLLAQRYEGDMAEGMWHGYGTAWERNPDGEGHSVRYVGEFQHDWREGRGVLTDFDYYMTNANPTEYRGGFRLNEPHGQCAITDLGTGEITFKGLVWLGEHYYGSQNQWNEDEKQFDLEYYERQYSNLIKVGPVEVGGTSNDPVGEGPLTIITPEEAENTEIIIADRTVKAGPIRHPYKKNRDGDALYDLYVTGFAENIAPGDYPQTVTIRFEREGKPEAVRLDVKRPFVLELR